MSESDARPPEDAKAPSGGSAVHAVTSVGAIFRTVKAVAWSFIGIRKSSSYQEDLSKLNPLHVIAVALVGVALFVGGLVLLVNWVVAK
jgi:amino acid transporter